MNWLERKIFAASMTVACLLLGIGLFSQETVHLSPRVAPDGAATDYASVIQETRKFILENMAPMGTVGMSFALVDGQDLIWSEGFGFQDREKGRQATADTLFMIGSVSKTFGCATVMQLVEKGLVNLDAPMSDALPEFSIKQRFEGSTITARTILTHHSGIPGDIFNNGFTVKPVEGFTPWLLEWLAKEYSTAPTDFVMAYNNSGFAILPALVERVARTDYASYSRANLFDRMGMSDSSFYASYYSSSYLDGNMARCYLGGRLYPQEYCDMSIAGSIISTANDMSKYMKMMHARGDALGGRVLKSETW